jgi:hypothetical protein
MSVINSTTNRHPIALSAAHNVRRQSRQSNNPAIRPSRSPAIPPSVIVKVTGNRAFIYQAVEIAAIDLPADIFTIAPIFESLLSQWWKDPINATAIKQTIFSLTSKRHFKGWRLLRLSAASKRARNDASIIRIVAAEVNPPTSK